MMHSTLLISFLLICAVGIKVLTGNQTNANPNIDVDVNKERGPDFTKKPGQNNWPGLYREGSRYTLGDWLLRGNWEKNSNIRYQQRNNEYVGYDGFYNNLAIPDRGAIDKPLLRRWPAAYKDGSYEPSGFNRPNPFNLSDQLLDGPIGTMSEKGRNALFLFFGQQVVEEILDAQRPACPPEYFNIEIPKGHRYRNHHTVMPLLRTRYDMRTGYSPNNPRQQLNEITPYLDGNLFYGSTKLWSDQLRTYSNGTIDPYGRLAFSHDGLFPEYNDHRLPMANPPPPIYHSHYTQIHETANVRRFFSKLLTQLVSQRAICPYGTALHPQLQVGGTVVVNIKQFNAELGNPRGNENAFLLSFGIMWFRWHNYLAERIHSYHPEWSSEKIYNEARKWVIATQQRIVVYEWLPVLLDESLKPYERYDASIDPQIDQFFQSAAFRFGHTLVTPGVYLRDYIRNNCNQTNFTSWKNFAVRTCNVFWRPQEPILNKTNRNDLVDIDRLLMGMSVQLTEKEDHQIVEDLRGNVFGPLEFPRRDLMAINIQRGRDHGLPDFNSARKAFGLEPYTSFNNFTSITAEIRKKLQELYKDINNIDPWIGGILETNQGPGELFRTVIKDQFQRIRDGDRFWYENKENKLFTPEEIYRINQLGIYDVLMAVTKMDADDIPKFPFRAAQKQNDSLLINQCNLTQMISNFYSLPQLNQVLLQENCTGPATYDYFSNSEVSYILTFIGVGTFAVGTAGVVYLLIKIKEKRTSEMNAKNLETRRSTLKHEVNVSYPFFFVSEWVGKKYSLRKVVVTLKQDKKQITITCYNGKLLRAFDFTQGLNKATIISITDEPTLVIQCIHNYDLVLKFETDYLKEHFVQECNNFFSNNEIEFKTLTLNWKSASKILITKDHHQKRLEMFFRVVFAQAFKIKHSKSEILKVDAYVAKEVVDTELTINEFADSLNMSPKNEFVKRMFSLIDKDRNGFISFREFVDLLIIFANGNEEQKAKLLFDMYDIDSTGELKQEDFVTMIKSFLETVGGKIDERDIQKTVNHMLEEAGIAHKKSHLTFEDFKKMIGEDIKNLKDAKLGFSGVKSAKSQNQGTFLQDAKATIENIYESHQEIQARFTGGQDSDTKDSKLIDERQEELIKQHEAVEPVGRTHAILRFIELKSKEIFWMTLYTLVLLAIFAERAYYYTVEREHSGLRTIAGYGVTITRGAASAMMFTYSSLLVTMCRNTITYLRDTVANNYFPFDASVDFHKYIALWAFIFTVIHIVGHAFNFYHISTQTADDLTCLFRNFFHSTHELPKFHYWCWQTVTGFTGILATLVFCVMYAFALPIIRRKIYNWFWFTHNLYPIFFILMILHGCGRLIQPPFTYYFLLGPLILFTLDTLKSISRKKLEIPVIHADILPSNVTKLEFQKPENFQYKAGQWVRIACLDLNKNEYHPFTLTSAPHENTLMLHIRAVGPWTMNIRNIYDLSNSGEIKLPKIYLDGPYGEGHQDWDTYDVAVLIAGGIGVTPFASILKDVAYSANKLRMRCKKVYFLWMSRTQKQFEWFVDIIRDVEQKDTTNFVSCHIFITQFYEKFDLRTILLYICERHYQRISNRSLFTNLRAVTHFGRPGFPQFFKTIQYIHESAQRIGVFSCGPPSMTSAVDQACSQINLQTEQRFEHHFKNF